MEQYRKKLKFENIVLAVIIAVLALFIALTMAGEAGLVPLHPAVGDSHWHSRWRGFCAGVAGGLLALMVVGLVRNLLAMGSQEKLKKLYIRQNDEREWEIYTKSLCAAMRLSLLLGVVAVVIVGYFNAVAGMTLLIALFCVSWISLAFRVYYRRKM